EFRRVLFRSKQFVEKLQLKNPVGTVITTGWGRGDDTDGTLDLEIVGVVDDFNLYGLQSEIPPMVFLHNTTVPWMVSNINSVYIKVSKDEMEKTIANLEKFWTKNVDQDYPFTYEFVDKLFANTYKEYIKQKKLFFVLNAIVILIALFGLFALASFSIQRRMKEIAIRKTLGAETKTLLDRKSTRLNSSHVKISYAVFCL